MSADSKEKTFYQQETYVSLLLKIRWVCNEIKGAQQRVLGYIQGKVALTKGERSGVTFDKAETLDTYHGEYLRLFDSYVIDICRLAENLGRNVGADLVRNDPEGIARELDPTEGVLKRICRMRTQPRIPYPPYIYGCIYERERKPCSGSRRAVNIPPALRPGDSAASRSDPLDWWS